MLCLSRYTEEKYAQHYGDNRHKFYLEFRCNRVCIKGMDVCAKCAEKSDTTKIQTSRKFDHGKVNEIIPDISHIFGGKWYYENLEKWGAPPAEIIEFALKCQTNAKGDFIVSQPIYEKSSKKTKQIKQKKQTEKVPQISTDDDNAAAGAEATTTNAIISPAPAKRGRKPKIAPSCDTINSSTEEPSLPKGRKGGNPYSVIVENRNKLIYKEVSIPTHIEKQLEEFDTDGFEIEYIRLVQFEVGQSTYFRDTKKNKLYKKIKEKGIGSYIGRWNPDTETILTDIPDSDDEE